MPIELTKNGVDSSYLGSIWFSKWGEKQSNILKKRNFSHYSYKKINVLVLGHKSVFFFWKEIKIFDKKNTYEIYWAMFGKLFGPYQYAKCSLMKSGQ